MVLQIHFRLNDREIKVLLTVSSGVNFNFKFSSDLHFTSILNSSITVSVGTQQVWSHTG